MEKEGEEPTKVVQLDELPQNDHTIDEPHVPLEEYPSEEIVLNEIIQDSGKEEFYNEYDYEEDEGEAEETFSSKVAMEFPEVSGNFMESMDGGYPTQFCTYT